MMASSLEGSLIGFPDRLQDLRALRLMASRLELKGFVSK